MENNKENRERLVSAIVEKWGPHDIRVYTPCGDRLKLERSIESRRILSKLIYYAAQALESDMEEWGDVDFKEEWGFYFPE